MQNHPLHDLSYNGLLNHRVRVAQPRKGYRSAIDPVLLAASVPEMPGVRILDLGCGVGVASFCLLERLSDSHVTGVEIHPEFAELSKKNAQINHKDHRFDVVCTDIQNFISDRPFDYAISNPPFYVHGTPSDDRGKVLSTMEQELPLEQWLDYTLKHIKPEGGFSIILPIQRLGESLLWAERKKVGCMKLFPLWPKKGRAAKRLIVQGWKGRQTPLTLSSGLILHTNDGDYTEDATRILRDAQGIDREL